MAESGNGLAKQREQQAQFVKFAGTRQRKMSTISSHFEAFVIRLGQTGIIFNQYVNDATLEKQECSRCGKSFQRKVGVGRPAKYCSRFCGQVAKGTLNDLDRRNQQCACCKAYFASDRKQKYCSVKCRYKGGRVHRYTKKCEACSAEYSCAHNRNRFCSIQCAGRNAGTVNRCIDCGAEYHSRSSVHVRCGRCQQSKRDLDQRIRFRFRHGKAKERPKGLSPRQIYNNSNGRCGICGDAIDWAIKWPHSMSMSVDHIVPLSKGGDDSESNLRASHLRCNCQRGSGN